MADPPLDTLTDLRRANAELAAARKAALNLMEDAILARDALRASEERHAFLLRLSDSLRPLADPMEVQAVAARLLGEYLGVDRAYYVELHEPDGEARVHREYLRGDSPSLVGRHRIADFGWVILPMRRGDMLVIPDVGTSVLIPPADRPAMDAIRIGAHVNAPLVKGGMLVGALCVTEVQPRAWTPGEVELVREVGERIWAAAERARAEAALRASEDRYRALVESQVEMVAQYRVDGTLLFVNAAYARAFGTTPQEMTGTNFWHLIPPEEHAGVRARLDELTPERPLIQIENMIRSTRGPRWTLWTNQALRFDEAGRVAEAQSAGVDITDRKEAEERLRLVVESAIDYAIFTLAPDRTVTSWSPGAVATFGYTADEMLGRSADELLTPEDRAAGVPVAKAETARREGRAADERWFVRKDGTRFFARGVLTPLGNDGHGFVKVLHDLTERKLAEDELERRVAERTAELAAVVDALESEVERRRELARRLATAQEDERRRVARDLHDTLGQLQAGLGLAVAAARRTPSLSPDAAELMASVQRQVDDLTRETHALAVRLRPTALDDLGLVPALRQLVSDVFVRSGLAADFQPAGLDGERLPPEVETAVYRVLQEALTNVTRHAKATRVGVAVVRTDGEVTATVEDDGVGFDPATSGVGRLGLLGMRERVELVGGLLQVESSPGGGTTLYARIPLSEGNL